jgi:hypothetical protein
METYVLLLTVALGGVTWALFRLCDRLSRSRP